MVNRYLISRAARPRQSCLGRVLADSHPARLSPGAPLPLGQITTHLLVLRFFSGFPNWISEGHLQDARHEFKIRNQIAIAGNGLG